MGNKSSTKRSLSIKQTPLMLRKTLRKKKDQFIKTMKSEQLHLA